MGLVAVMATWLVPTHALLIKTASGRKETVIWGHDAGYLRVVRDKIRAILSTPVAGGFVGAYIAMYASSNGQPSANHVDFDWFEYQGN